MDSTFANMFSLGAKLEPILTQWLAEKRLRPSRLDHIWRIIAWAATCAVGLSVGLPLFTSLGPLLGITASYFWFAILTRRVVTSSTLYLLLWASFLTEVLPTLVTGSRSWPLFAACGLLVLLPWATLRSLRPASACQIIAFVSFVRVLSLADPLVGASTLRPGASLVCGFLGIVGARWTEGLTTPPLAALIATDGRLVAWKRRRSSSSTLGSSPKPRRTSLPSLGGSRTPSFHGNHVSPRSQSLRCVCTSRFSNAALNCSFPSSLTCCFFDALALLPSSSFSHLITCELECTTLANICSLPAPRIHVRDSLHTLTRCDLRQSALVLVRVRVLSSSLLTLPPPTFHSRRDFHEISCISFACRLPFIFHFHFLHDLP